MTSIVIINSINGTCFMDREFYKPHKLRFIVFKYTYRHYALVYKPFSSVEEAGKRYK